MADAQAPTTEPNMQETSRGNLLLGDLPSDFLCVPSAEETTSQVQRDGLIAKQMAAQEFSQQRVVQQQPMILADRLFISVMEAKLNKNYGLTKMDPYCKVKVNHQIFETDTSYNGAKNPTWNKPFSLSIADPVDIIYIDVMDEKSLQGDLRVAWTKISLPEAVKHGEQVDDWWPLSGKLGEDMEGSIHVVITKKRVQQSIASSGMPVMFHQAGFPLVSQVPQAGAPYYPGAAPGMPLYYPPGAQPPQMQQQQQQQPPVQQGPLFTEEDVKQLKEMFPDVDEDVVKTVLEASRGNKDAAINSLLNMQ